MHASSGEGCLRGRRGEHKALRHRCLLVIILSEQPSDGKPSLSKVLDVEVQVLEAPLSVPTGNFQLDLPKLLPLRIGLLPALGLETETACPCRLHPRPCDIQVLEIHVCA